jgi:hypothetical protein
MLKEDKGVMIAAGFASGAIANFIVSKAFPDKPGPQRTVAVNAPLALWGCAYAYAYDDARGWYFATGVVGETLLAYFFEKSRILKETSMVTQIEEDPFDDHVMVDGFPVPIRTKGLFRLEDFTENPNRSLMGKEGRHYPRQGPMKFLVFHHGGYDIDNLHRAFQDPNRPYVSSHFAIGLDDDGEVTIAQFLDTQQVSNHAGYHNPNSIGIDFAISPLPENASRYGLPTTQNTSPYGTMEVTRFPDKVLQAAAQLTRELHRIYGLDVKFFPDVETRHVSVDDLLTGPYSDVSVVSHHNVQAEGGHKWDVAYLWDRLQQAYLDTEGT